jgi:hypothetical protein
MIHGDLLQGAARHVGEDGLRGILDDGHPAAVVDGGKSGRAVAQEARQHDPDDPRAVGERRGPEERIGRRPVPVLPGSVDDSDPSVLDDQVPVGRGDEDPTEPDRISVAGMIGSKRSGGREDLRHEARPLRRNVKDDEDRGRKIRRKAGDEFAQGLNPSRGSADDDDVVPRLRIGHRLDSGPFVEVRSLGTVLLRRSGIFLSGHAPSGCKERAGVVRRR